MASVGSEGLQSVDIDGEGRDLALGSSTFIQVCVVQNQQVNAIVRGLVI